MRVGVKKMGWVRRGLVAGGAFSDWDFGFFGLAGFNPVRSEVGGT